MEKDNLGYFFSFEDVWERVKKNTTIKNRAQLARFIGVSQTAVTKRKNTGKWPVVWAYAIADKNNLLTEWVLTGKGPKSLSKPDTISYSSETVRELDEWLAEIAKDEPFRISWFKGIALDHIPGFKQWKKERS